MLDALIVFFVFFFPPIVFFIWYFWPQKSARSSALADGVDVERKGFVASSSASTREQGYNINGLPMAGGVDVNGNAFGVM